MKQTLLTFGQWNFNGQWIDFNRLPCTGEYIIHVIVQIPIKRYATLIPQRGKFKSDYQLTILLTSPLPSLFAPTSRFTRSYE